ncbi:MAG: NTPase [Candidatus Hodarchaeota archaeon]
MSNKILITGPPRCGKSTLISKLIKYFSERNSIIYGFLTPEVREHGNRIGFDILDIYSGEKSQLARVGNFNTKSKLGKYNVFVEEFDRYLENTLKIEGKTVDLIIIDEIGKMELFSEKFQDFIKIIFNTDISIIATMGLNLRHSLKNYLLDIPSVHLLKLNPQNFHLIFKEVISVIS